MTGWDPPRKWAAESAGWVPGSPPIADEWTVEARGGGICVVRIVHSLFASTDDWDNQLEGTESGWPAFLRTLRIYLTHFRGQRSATMKWMANVAGTEAEAWKTFTAALGVKGVNVGQRWAAPAGVPALSGVAEYVSQSPYDVLLRVDKPGPGVAALGAFSMGGQSMVALGFYLYGDQAAGNRRPRDTTLGSVDSETLPDADGAGQERVSRVVRLRRFLDGRPSRDHCGLN